MMIYLRVLLILLFSTLNVTSITISPHGGYLSIDEGSDFFIECIGNDPKWVIAQHSTSSSAKISTETIQNNRKSILIIEKMDSSLTGPYICQTNQTFATIILHLIKRQVEMTKQIHFLTTNINYTVEHGNEVRLNCFGQYYSEKPMDSPYLPRILWFFERKQLFHNENKYIIGSDSLVIRNFTYYDQGIYYCRAFITSRNNFLMKTYPILVSLQNSSFGVNDPLSFEDQNQMIDDSNEIIKLNTTTLNVTCPKDFIWNDDYSQCSPTPSQNQIVQIIPNLSEMYVEMGRTYTILCRSNDEQYEPEWIYENGTVIVPNTSPEQPITSYTLNEKRAVYLRLAPVISGTYICRSRLAVIPINKKEITIQTTSITLTTEMIAGANGISFQSPTLPEYHVRLNATLFLACRPEYFHFRSYTNESYLPLAKIIRINDNKHFQLSAYLDGILIDQIRSNESGMYLCMGIVPTSKRLITSYYPIMVFVSDP